MRFLERRPWAAHTDLLLSAALALSTPLLVASSITALRTLIALAMVLIVPGYVLLAAVYPAMHLEHKPESVERLIFSIALSITVSVIAGFVLHNYPAGLQAGTWALALMGVTLWLSGVAWLRRRPLYRQRPMASPSATDIRLTIGQLVALSISVTLVIVALDVARQGVERQSVSHITQLWMIPVRNSSGEATALTMGIKNDDTVPLAYHLRLTQGNRIVADWSVIELQPGQQWETPQSLAGLAANIIDANSEKLEGVLYRLDAPNQIYRRVDFSLSELTH